MVTLPIIKIYSLAIVTPYSIISWKHQKPFIMMHLVFLLPDFLYKAKYYQFIFWDQLPSWCIPQHFHLTHISSSWNSHITKAKTYYLIYHYLFFSHGSGCGLVSLIEFEVAWRQRSCLIPQLYYLECSRWCWAKSWCSINNGWFYFLFGRRLK